MTIYENIVILDPNSAESSIEETLGKIKSTITNKGGEIIKSENWGRKKLAYEIKKQKTGIYILLLFKASPDTIADLERFYGLQDSLLKFLFIKLKKKQAEASLVSLPTGQAGPQAAGTPTPPTLQGGQVYPPLAAPEATRAGQAGPQAVSKPIAPEPSMEERKNV